MHSWRGIVLCLLSLTGLSGGGAESVKVEGVLIDNWCALTTRNNAMAREHTRACALMDGCVNSGFAIYAGGKVIKFDRAGRRIRRATSKLGRSWFSN